MKWYAGTSGYSYKEWKNTFYPADLKSEDWLAFYASQLPAVEINNTFYRMPRVHVVEGWAAAVPDTFRFVLKASRRITHQARLKDVEESLDYLVKRVSLLEDKLGAVLFQLPPYLRKDLDRLTAFLALWPRELPAAFEFRHASWFDDDVIDTLRTHGLALVVTDDETLTHAENLPSAEWIYLRLRNSSYTSQKLAGWIKRSSANNPTTGYAFFKHEDAGAGPSLARRFLNLAEKPVPKRAPARKSRRQTRQARPQ